MSKAIKRSSLEIIRAPLVIILTAITGVLLVGISLAASDIAMSLVPANISVQQNNTFSVQVWADNHANPAQAVYSNLTYDSNILTYEGFQKGQNQYQDCADPQLFGNGEVTITCWNDQALVTGNQLLGTVSFTANSAGQTTLVMEDSSAGVDKDNNSYTASTANTAVTITPPPSAIPPPSPSSSGSSAPPASAKPTINSMSPVTSSPNTPVASPQSTASSPNQLSDTQRSFIIKEHDTGHKRSVEKLWYLGVGFVLIIISLIIWLFKTRMLSLYRFRLGLHR